MLLSRFIQNITDKKLFYPADRLLLAVSGGLDSVVLCDLCHKAGFTFDIAHANFQLRAEESVIDECFVKGLAHNYRVPFRVRKFDTELYARQNKVSTQVAARELRYAWFNELMNDGPAYVLTGHHADDNIETVLMNFFRGTGIAGLRGMLPKHDRIIRPLLFASRNEILEYARENKLSWREDSSNASDKYSRNYFRNAIIPMIYKIFPEVESNLVDNIRRFSEIKELYDQAINLHIAKLVERKGSEVHIPVLKLKKTNPLETVLFEITRQFNFSSHQLHDIIHLLDAEQGRYVQSSTHRIIRNRGWLIISPVEHEKSSNIIIEEDDTSINFAGGILELSNGSTDNLHFSSSTGAAELDRRKVRFPLILRKWKAGDYFYPLGMKKKKKVSRFLIDHKLSPPEKEKVWVLESAKKICWVVGMRIDERFKIAGSTRETLKLRISS